MNVGQSPFPAYSDLQIALALVALVAALVFAVVVAPTALGGCAYWIARRRPPSNRFVRLSMVTSLVVMSVGALIVIYSNLVSPDSGATYWLPVSLMLLAGAIAVVSVLRRWIGSDTDSPRP